MAASLERLVNVHSVNKMKMLSDKKTNVQVTIGVFFTANIKTTASRSGILKPSKFVFWFVECECLVRDVSSHRFKLRAAENGGQAVIERTQKRKDGQCKRLRTGLLN